MLLAGNEHGAYYLAGYCVECALKACIARLTNQYDFPDKKIAQKCWSHNLEELVGVAGLAKQRELDCALVADLQLNWGVVKDWTEQSRYDRKRLQQAQDLFAAITDPQHGVLPWIKQYW